jgi:beta-lactamase regulating signal transducer with metallopeptidase domain
MSSPAPTALEGTSERFRLTGTTAPELDRDLPATSRSVTTTTDSPAATTGPQSSAAGANRVATTSPGIALASGLALVWLGGVLALSAYVVIQMFRFRSRLRHATAPADPAAASLLNDCRRELGVRRRLELVETSAVASPALFGLFRLRLLLPKGLVEKFSPGELRYIFLHELAHAKRRDLWLNWLVTALQILHWFNPLIWFGFARLRADRELACDELTLLCAGENVGESYGETVIKLLEGIGRPAAIPGLIGILEDQKQMRRRIRMIANFRRPGRWSALAALVLVVLAITALTDAQTGKPASEPLRGATRYIGNQSITSPLVLTDGNSVVIISVDGETQSFQQTFWFRADQITNRLDGSRVNATKASDARNWTISGRVLDSETKQPIDRFRVSAGQLDGLERINWNTYLCDGTNGTYLAHLSKRFGEIWLKVEAAHYLPAVLTLRPRDTTNADFFLVPGSGLAGRVVLPDGRPAAGATVVMFDNDWDQASFNAEGRLSVLYVGQFDVHRNEAFVHETGANGEFSFKAEWGIKAVAAGSPEGFAVVDPASLATSSTIRLQPYGRISGTLKRGSVPVAYENLNLSFGDGGSPMHANLNLHAQTDADGRYQFDRVPPGNLQIFSRDSFPRPVSLRNAALAEAELKPGQTLELNLAITNLPAPPRKVSNPRPRPEPTGAEIKGRVLSPGGKPATGAQVAVALDGEGLKLGKASLSSGDPRFDPQVRATSDADGNFTLPMYETANSVVAVNDDGFAQVPLEELKTSPQIRLQPWGQIEGTLQVKGHPGTNETLIIDSANFGPLRLYYDNVAFRTRTDAQGAFTITYVPPGENYIVRRIAIGPGSWVFYPLGTVEVKPGDTTHVSLDASGRTVVGSVKFIEPDAAPAFTHAMADFHTPFKSRSYKTTEEMKSAMQSQEYKKERRDSRSYPVTLGPDGSFRAEDIPPGQYEFNVHFYPDDPSDPSFYGFMSRTPFTIHESGNKSDSAPVDLGVIELKKRPILPAEPEAKTK